MLFRSPQKISRRVAREVLELSEYDIEIHHIKGTSNGRADCYDQGSDFSARLLTGYDYGTPQVSSYISHGQSSQSAKEYHMYDNDSFLGSAY